MHSACQSQPKKPNLQAVSLCFAPVLWPPEDLEVRAWKETEKRRKNNVKFSGHYVRLRTHYVRSEIVVDHQNADPLWPPQTFLITYFKVLKKPNKNQLKGLPKIKITTRSQNLRY